MVVCRCVISIDSLFVFNDVSNLTDFRFMLNLFVRLMKTILFLPFVLF